MATIMTQTSGGHTRVCNARCHCARSNHCRCICGGKYHSKGSSRLAAEALRKDISQGLLGKETAEIAINLEAVI